jgi:hypothetical protein
LTERSISVSIRASPVADEYETVWAPILKPLYRIENRRLRSARRLLLRHERPEEKRNRRPRQIRPSGARVAE